MAYKVEVTDTFGGEANYSWVRRYTVETPSCEYGTSERSQYSRTLVRRAKKAAGWAGLRCQVDNHGDSITVRPVGRKAPCWIMFIDYDDSPESEEGEE